MTLRQINYSLPVVSKKSNASRVININHGIHNWNIQFQCIISFFLLHYFTKFCFSVMDFFNFECINLLSFCFPVMDFLNFFKIFNALFYWIWLNYDAQRWLMIINELQLNGLETIMHNVFWKLAVEINILKIQLE